MDFHCESTRIISTDNSYWISWGTFSVSFVTERWHRLDMAGIDDDDDLFVAADECGSWER